MKIEIKLKNPKYCGHYYSTDSCPLLTINEKYLGIYHICRMDYKIEDRYPKNSDHPKIVLRPTECIKKNGK